MSPKIERDISKLVVIPREYAKIHFNRGYTVYCTNNLNKDGSLFSYSKNDPLGGNLTYYFANNFHLSDKPFLWYAKNEDLTLLHRLFYL